jgi:hypothetical protein
MSKKSGEYLNQKNCRLLKIDGYSDEELKNLGYDEDTIRRTIVALNGPRINKTTKRCKECGAKCYYLDRGGDCYECALKTKIAREGKIPSTDKVFANDGWKQCQKMMDDPDGLI